MERAQDGAFARMMDLIRQRQQKVDELTYWLERGERFGLELARRRLETVSAAVRHYDLRRVLAGVRTELEAGTAALGAAMRNQLLLHRVRLERMARAAEQPPAEPTARPVSLRGPQAEVRSVSASFGSASSQVKHQKTAPGPVRPITSDRARLVNNVKRRLPGQSSHAPG